MQSIFQLKENSRNNSFCVNGMDFEGNMTKKVKTYCSTDGAFLFQKVQCLQMRFRLVYPS